VHWQAVEESFRVGPADLSRPLRLRLEFRHPVDLGDAVVLRRWDLSGKAHLALEAGDVVKAVAVLGTA
jgi:hypothetical protein